MILAVCFPKFAPRAIRCEVVGDPAAGPVGLKMPFSLPSSDPNSPGGDIASLTPSGDLEGRPSVGGAFEQFTRAGQFVINTPGATAPNSPDSWVCPAPQIG